MRPLSLLLLFLVTVTAFSALFGCDDERDPGGGVFVGPAPRHSAAGAAASADARADGPVGAMISGRVETDDGQPIIGRPLAVVDARGQRREVLSDEGGGFNVPDVVRPYDLAVAGNPSEVTQTPTVFLGITREDPFVELFERDGPKTRPAAQTLRFAVKPPACAATSCAVSVVSGSATGSGASSVSYRDEISLSFEIEHAWDAVMVGAKESIAVHVLAFDESQTTFAYAHVEGIRAEAGDLTELGILEPTAVPASEPIVVAALARGPAAAWSPTIQTWLELPGGATLPFTYGPNREESVRIPVIHGATLRASAWMQHPKVEDRPQFHASAHAWSGLQAITSDGGTLSLTLPFLPTLVRPEMDGHLSAGGLGIAWTNPSSAPMPVTEMSIGRDDTGALRYRVWTIGDEVPFAKLATLGIQPLAPGDHTIAITSSPIDALDDLVHPDAKVRRARLDPRRRGAVTYQRFQFKVTP